MELYTSLTHLKRALNGGQLPPMTPIPPSVHHVIDPGFTVGLGALDEDVERGLRCPVRGCGNHYLGLRRHLNRHHADVGGASGVLGLLGIPETVSLNASASNANRTPRRAPPRPPKPSAALRREWGRKGGLARSSTNYKNLRDRCVAQLQHKIIDLANRLGRSPSLPEFRHAYGHGVRNAVVRTFGSWNSAKALCGLEVWVGRSPHHKPKSRARRITSVDILPALAAWHQQHGELPGAADADLPTRVPMIPSKRTILTAFDTSSWPEAMRRAASLLNIFGGRYGLPEKKAS